MNKPVYRAVVIAVLISFSLGGVSAQEAEGKKKPKRTGIFELIDQRQRRKDMMVAINNAKQLFYLMIEFDQDFGEFPSDATAKAEKDLTGYIGKHSNDYLGQFFAGGYTRSEEIFYARGGSSTPKKPDNDTSTKAKTLEAGECGFAYMSGQSISDNSGRPLLCAPMTGKGVKFDPKPFGGKAVVLRLDGAVKTYEIDEKGDVVLPNGKKLFENGEGTVWGEAGFDLKKLKHAK